MLGRPNRARRFSTAIFGTFSTFTFAFLTHTMAPQITAELRNPSRGRLVSARGPSCRSALSFVFRMLRVSERGGKE